MGIGVLAIVVLAALFGAGVWLLFRGVRGDRVPEHRVCRACRFDLSGLEPDRCPECGVVLTGPAAVRVVRRRRNPKRAWTGAALVVAAMAAPASVLIDSAMSGRLSAVLPTWVLSLELRVMRASTPKSVSEELFARCVKGEVSDSTLRIVATAISEMPGKANDGSLAPSLNELVGDATAKGLITKDVLARHVVTRVLMEAQVPERISVDDPIVDRLINLSTGESRTPLSGLWIVCRRVTGIELDGVPQQSRAAKSEQEASEWVSACISTPSMVTHVMPPGLAWQSVPVPVVEKKTAGPHTVKLNFVIEVFSGPGDTTPGRAVASREYPLKVVAADEPLVELVEDEALRKQLASALRPTVMRQRGTLSASVSMSAKFDAVAPKPSVAPTLPGARVGGAWDMFIEIDGVRLPAGKYKLGWRPEGGIFQSSWWVSTPKLPAEAASCRMILVPNEQYGAQRDAIDLMPAGEIVIEDVPIN